MDLSNLKAIKIEQPEPPIKAWSFSRWKAQNECPYRLYLQVVKKEPELPPTPGVEAPKDRGTRIHQIAEDYVRGISDETLPKELKKFEEDFAWARSKFPEGNMSLEDNWAFDKEWRPLDDYFAPEVWNRTKLDLLHIFDDGTSALIVDHKTGKKFGNEVSHTLQGQNYALTTFIMYPNLHTIEAAFWYLDHGEKHRVTYTIDDFPRLMKTWTERGREVTERTMFEPKANRMNCRFCPYGVNDGKGTGACPHAVPWS